MYKGLLLSIAVTLGLTATIECKKGAWTNFGSISKSNGSPRTKSISGYWKPSSNWSYVNPYYRSR